MREAPEGTFSYEYIPGFGRVYKAPTRHCRPYASAAGRRQRTLISWLRDRIR
jgi:hypothetical protein